MTYNNINLFEEHAKKNDQRPFNVSLLYGFIMYRKTEPNIKLKILSFTSVKSVFTQHFYLRYTYLGIPYADNTRLYTR